MNRMDMMGDFLEEARNVIHGLRELSFRIGEEPGLAQEAMRLFHTLKGSAGFMGFDAVSDLCHAAEEVLLEGEALPGNFPRFLRALTRTLSEVIDTIQSTGAELPSCKESLDPFLRALRSRDFSGHEDESVAPGEAGIRLSPDKLDGILALLGSVEVVKNRISQETPRLPGDVVRSFHDLERLLDALRDEIMDLRMVDMSGYLSKLGAVAREIAAELGKEVEFVARGGEVRVDRAVADEIMDALTHLIRNALDHGIESPLEREKMGKDRRGRVEVRIHQEGNRVIIEVSDDGAGVDTEALRKKVKKAYGPGDISDEELFQFLFIHGFSLREETTRLSGRGVGLDVVKECMDRVGGTVFFETERGRGTTITMELPLTLLVTPLSFVRIGNETFGLPLSAILKVDWREDVEIVSLGEKGFVKEGQKTLALVEGGELLRAGGKGDMIITLRHGTGEFCLSVDEVLPEADAVIRPLGRLLRVEAFSGTVIGDDGRPVLVLNPAFLSKQGGKSA